MRHVVNGTPVVLGAALIVPAGLMNKLRGDEPVDPVAATFAADAAARSRIEQLAMTAVRQAEAARLPRRRCFRRKMRLGLDFIPASRGRQAARSQAHRGEGPGEGREHHHDHPQRNALRLQSGDKFVLAVAIVGEDDAIDGLHYIPSPFDRELRLGRRVHHQAWAICSPKR